MQAAVCLIPYSNKTFVDYNIERPDELIGVLSTTTGMNY